jgi:hypothetical protein
MMPARKVSPPQKVNDTLDAVAVAPWLAVLVTIGLFVALIVETITFDQWMIAYPASLVAIGAYALGRNVRR